MDLFDILGIGVMNCEHIRSPQGNVDDSSIMELVGGGRLDIHGSVDIIRRWTKGIVIGCKEVKVDAAIIGEVKTGPGWWGRIKGEVGRANEGACVWNVEEFPARFGVVSHTYGFDGLTVW